MSTVPTITLIWTAECVRHIDGDVFLYQGPNVLPVATWERVRPMVADLVVSEDVTVSPAALAVGRIIEPVEGDA